MLGTAFFINEEGLFITAGHVIDDYLKGNALKVFFMNPVEETWMPVAPTHIARHPVLDVAIGIVPVPSFVTLDRFVLGDSQLPTGERVLAFGYSGTQVEERPGTRSGLPGLALHFSPKFHEGELDAYYPKGFGLARDMPVLVHTAQILGAMSGGPLIRHADSAVYGVTCSGSDAYGTAVDVRSFLDWPISFFGNRSLRDAANAGRIRVRGPDG